MNGIANGPNTAPIIAQKRVFAPLLSAMDHKRAAQATQIIEIMIAPIMIFFLFVVF
jgi:hypothetical protein